ncbi:NCS2 family permease [Halorussus aquaticus]|uniref:NCS2 family permease n=1 Tax=Halorussus aquaticus TaxID=2953748 RepID=A0ABD5Q2V5_9EURY|nr:NCS2 family permease [Halorussus aquaticus]
MGIEETSDSHSDSGNSGALAEYFGFSEHGTDLRTEILAGLTTFLTMSYIVVVNPQILAQAIQLQGYSTSQTTSMLAVVTIIAAAVATLTMALYANRPFAQAPGLGLNAFFAFTVVGSMGISWQTALAAVFVEGIVFIALTAVGAREYVIRIFPEPVKLAVGTGIGLFLAIIGLEAMGIITGDAGTIVALAQVGQSPVAIVSIVGLFVTFALYARGIPGSIVLGIVLTSALGYGAEWFGLVPGGTLTPSSTQVTYNIAPVAGAFLEGLGDVEAFSFALVVFTFFFVDFFDTAGTLTGVSQIAGFLDENGNLPDIDKPLMADAIGTTVGGMLGTSTVTTYIESASGVEEGGRTGMTALTVALLFLLSLAFIPIAAAIPLYASHIALVVIGVVMFQNVVDIDWSDITNVIPAGMTILIMPFAFSIAYGIAAGIVSYPIVKLAAGEVEDTRPGHWVLAAAFVVYFFVRTSGLLQGNL